MKRNPVVLSYGGGFNSTAMITGIVRRGEPLDLVLFADTGAELPAADGSTRTEYVQRVSDYLESNGYPAITTVRWIRKGGEFLDIEALSLQRGELPSLAYGFKGCSVKFKRQPMDKFVESWPVALEAWDNGLQVERLIGYHHDEVKRQILSSDPRYVYRYPLREWRWGQLECEEEIRCAGLPMPGKSSCFFCPAMRKREILDLEAEHPSLMERALAIEEGAKATLRPESDIKGLGRTWRWADFLASAEAAEMRKTGGNAQRLQRSLFAERIDAPCDCMDMED